MDDLKKFFFILLIIVLVVGSGVGGFYLIKKYKLSQYPNTPIAEQVNIPGLVRDEEGKIPRAFPEDLLVQADIAGIIESYYINKEGIIGEITFRYVSSKAKDATITHFKKYLSTGEWRLLNTLVEKEDFASLSAVKNTGEKIYITINSVPSSGPVVDITYIE